MAFSILLKTNGLLALCLLPFCSVREQRSAKEKPWRAGERGVRKTGDEVGESDASAMSCRARAKSKGRRRNMGNGSIESTYCQVIVPQ
jgi:hypothetical protein